MDYTWSDNSPEYKAAFDAKHEAYEEATMVLRVYGDNSPEYRAARAKAEELARQFRMRFSA